MAKSLYAAQPFFIEVANQVVDSTELKRKVFVRLLEVSWETRTVRIVANTVFFSKLEDDSYGSEIKSIGRPLVEIIASEQFVDANTGAVLEQQSEQQIPAEIEYIHEFDFFDRLATLSPIVVKDLITTYIQTAFASGKYNA